MWYTLHINRKLNQQLPNFVLYNIAELLNIHFRTKLITKKCHMKRILNDKNLFPSQPFTQCRHHYLTYFTISNFVMLFPGFMSFAGHFTLLFYYVYVSHLPISVSVHPENPFSHQWAEVFS